MKKGTAIVWFTNDLRLEDNGVLRAAMDHHEHIVPVVCIDKEYHHSFQWGFRRTGARRMQFLLESIADLQVSLHKAGAHLQIEVGNPVEAIVNRVRATGASIVYAKKEVGYEELQLQQRFMKELWKCNAELSVISTSTLFHPEDLPFGVRDVPEIFTDFRKRAERETMVRAVIEKPAEIVSPELPVSTLPSLEQLGYEAPTTDARSVLAFRGGESAAMQRLSYYLGEKRLLSNYKETRNGLIGGDYSSKFSPWLAMGCISPRTIYEAVQEYERTVESNDSTYWLIFELIWRDYFRFAMKKHKQSFFRLGGIQGKQVPSARNKEIIQRWIDGNTGVSFVDANMRELRSTGFMSNRGRQNVASYFCNDLKQDWRMGAAYFEEQLIDYDVASNWGNWAYLAGVGNDPRGNRYFDIEKQARQYDGAGEYRRMWGK
ncbi:MAG: DASH family cryptochrome [Flavobacteriales bacterium]